ncbi:MULTISPECIES: hypothetical protein [Burkholderia]|uniref:hypothetical protein n=1 Tax=Burkholderia TaxID=32008 RepID=UPI000F597AEC|nr:MULTISPECIES: hypothetical protein [Burkholderia]MBN3738604.1 hypothetical protein [Burkholderia sp. Tr-20355]RQS84234.1 hypothetical protein DF032_03955 [Burkholderia seminalis]
MKNIRIRLLVALVSLAALPSHAQPAAGLPRTASQPYGASSSKTGHTAPTVASFGNQFTWLNSLIPCTTACAQTWSQSAGGGMGLLGATRTSDNSLTGSMAAQGVAGYAINDNTVHVQTAYATYSEARRRPGAGTTQGHEIDVVNQGSVVGLDPYDMFRSGITPGLWLSSGRRDVKTGAANASAAVGIVNNNTAFENGIVFQSSALNTTTGEGNAIVLPRKDAVVWFGSAGNKVAAIRSDATTASLRAIFANGLLALQNLSGVNEHTFSDTGNYSAKGNISAGGTGSMPLYSPTGAGANAPHMVHGSVALASGSATVKLTGPAVYTSASSYTCTANDTTAANAVKVSQDSGALITFTGTGTNTVQFLCAGN